MKNKHIVQFLQAFPFNQSCNQLLDEFNNLKNLNKLSSLEKQESSQQSMQPNSDLTFNPSAKVNQVFQLFKLLDFCKFFHKKLNNTHNSDVNSKRSCETNRNVHKIEIHLYDLLFLVQKIKFGLETSEDVYKIMTDEKSKTKMFVPLYFEIVTNNGEGEAEVYLELIQDEQYPSFVELYSKNTPNGFELNEFLNLNIYFSHFISFLMSWLCKQDVLEKKGKTNFIKYFQFFLKTQDKITDFIKNLG